MTHLYVANLVYRLLMSVLAIGSMGYFWSRIGRYLGPLLSVLLGMVTVMVLTVDALILYTTRYPYTPRAFVVTIILTSILVTGAAYAVHRRFKERP